MVHHELVSIEGQSKLVFDFTHIKEHRLISPAEVRFYDFRLAAGLQGNHHFGNFLPAHPDFAKTQENFLVLVGFEHTHVELRLLACVNKLRTVILDDVDILIFLNGLRHSKETAVRLAASVSPGGITEGVTRANNVARHLDFGELGSIAMRKAEHERFASRLRGTIKVHRQVASHFAHRRAHTAHRRGATGIDELLAARLGGILKQRHCRPGIVHQHSGGRVSPAESDMDTGVATFESFGHLFEIRQGAFHERDIRHSLERRNLIRVASSNHYLVTFFKQSLDHIVTNEASTASNKHTHTYTSLYLQNTNLFNLGQDIHSILLHYPQGFLLKRLIMARMRVLVLMGGPSTEHDVSVVSGTGVVRAMNPDRYNIHPVLIDKDGTWHWSSRELSPYQKDNFSVNYFRGLEGTAANCKKSPALSELPDADIAFLALHGKWGEDGHIQAMLENWGIPYTGCGLLASALAMDKVKTKEIYRANGIPTPPYRVIWKHDFTGDTLVSVSDELGFPLVIKDPLGGSSIGIGIAKDLDEAGKIAQDLFKDSNRLLCEKFIAGEEASCGYIEGEKPLPPTEMRMTTREYFDYEAKYNGECKEVTPAEFDADLTARIQELVKNAHYALGGAGYSRTDVRITKDKQLFAIETNTLPGMTPTSILPAEAASVGITYSQLIDLIIDKSLYIKR